MANFITNTRMLNTDLAALLLRLTVGGMFIFHGWMKIDNYHTFLPMFTDIIGIGTKLSYHLLIFAEFVCGIFVAAGFLTRLTVIPILVAMIIAYFIAHKNDGFLMKMLPFVYIWLTLAIWVAGSGKYSVDHLLFRKKNNP